MVPTKIGIRQLVEFILRSGDLNPTANSQNTALKGAQIHRRLQKKRGADYEKEYAVNWVNSLTNWSTNTKNGSGGSEIGEVCETSLPKN